MTSGFENATTQKTENEAENIPKVDQGDAMESFLEREYEKDNKKEDKDLMFDDLLKYFEDLSKSTKEEIKGESNQKEKQALLEIQNSLNNFIKKLENSKNNKPEDYEDILIYLEDRINPYGDYNYRGEKVNLNESFYENRQRLEKFITLLTKKRYEKLENNELTIEIIKKDLGKLLEYDGSFNDEDTKIFIDKVKQGFEKGDYDLPIRYIESAIETCSSEKNSQDLLEEKYGKNREKADILKDLRSYKEFLKSKNEKEKSQKEPEGEILEMHDLKSEKEDEIIEMEDLEDKELIKLSNEMKKAREDYNKNKEKTDGAWQRIRNVFPKLVLGENSASVQEAQIYLKRYEEARNNLLKYQTEKLKKRNLPKEKRLKEVADLSKHYNEDEQYDSLDKKTGEKFRFPDEEKNENKTRKKEKKESSAEKNRKKALGEMFKKYKINEKDGYYDQSSGFIDKLMREVAMGHYENWKNSKDKKMVDFIDEKGKSRDEVSKNIQKMEKYFENILGEKGKFEKNETVKQWLVRMIKESLEANK